MMQRGRSSMHTCAANSKYHPGPLENPISFILGMNIKRDWEAGTLHLSQPSAIEKLAMKFDLTGKSGRAPT